MGPCICVRWAYIDPSNGGVYEQEEQLEETSLDAAYQWAVTNVPLDHTFSLTFHEF